MRQADEDTPDEDNDEEEESKDDDVDHRGGHAQGNPHENRIEMLLSEMRSEGGSIDLNPPQSSAN